MRLNKKSISLNDLCEIEEKEGSERVWQIVAQEIGEKQARDLLDSMRKALDGIIAWQKKRNELRALAPEKVYRRWCREYGHKPWWGALDKLEEIVKGKRCEARNCNSIFVPAKSNQRYCSKTCRDREAKARYRQRKETV